MERMFMVRCGEENYLFDDFYNKHVVAIGWNEIGDVSHIETPDQIKILLRQHFPEYKLQTVNMNAGQIYRFSKDFKVGDYAITYNSSDRIYLVGIIKSDYAFDTAIDYHHIREMDWIGQVSRDSLSTTAKNSLGSIATVFEVSDRARTEILNLLKEGEESYKNEEVVSQENETLDFIKDDFESKAHEFIKDKVLSLSWEEMQELVASIIRSLGFKTRVSSKGSDRGKDIVASPDGLGLEEPRIIVEVKHRTGQMGSTELRSFLGGFRPGNKGIYVSTGGFSKEAKYEAERANHPITLIDADYLVELIIDNYDKFDLDGRALIPLRKVYWPI
jgi:restriction system protein